MQYKGLQLSEIFNFSCARHLFLFECFYSLKMQFFFQIYSPKTVLLIAQKLLKLISREFCNHLLKANEKGKKSSTTCCFEYLRLNVLRFLFSCLSLLSTANAISRDFFSDSILSVCNNQQNEKEIDKKNLDATRIWKFYSIAIGLR